MPVNDSRFTARALSLNSAILGSVIFCSGFMVGCGGESITRAEVSGNVTLNEKPLEEGVILFTPLEAGPSAGGDIRDGKFRLSQENGPSPGKYRVEIRAYRGTGKMTKDEASGETQEEMVSIVPARYNSKSSLEAEVKAEGPNEYSFQLSGG